MGDTMQAITEELQKRLSERFPVDDVRVNRQCVYVNGIQVLEVKEIENQYGRRSRGTGRYRFSWPNPEDHYTEGGSRQTRGNEQKGYTQPYDEVIEAAVTYYHARCAKMEADRVQRVYDEQVRAFTPEWGSSWTDEDGNVYGSWGKIGKIGVYARSTPLLYGVQFESKGPWVLDDNLESLRDRCNKIASLMEQIQAIAYRS